MPEQYASNVGPSLIDIAYESFGEINAPPLLLIMGLGGQMLGWHEDFCSELATRGLRPIRFDNRDCGHSTHFAGAPEPNLSAALTGDVSTATYGLADMAADAVGLLDALLIDRAHIVGISMGGQIAQIIATEFPARVRSLTSMMSWTGARDVGQPAPEVMNLFRRPPAQTREQAMDNAVAAFRVIGSPGYPLDEAMVRDRAALAFDRDHDLTGLKRQAMAAIVSGDRTARLATVRAPTLVIHGLDDRMVDPSGGRATAAAIPGAELVMIEGLGHNLPRELWPRLAGLIAKHAHGADNTQPR